MEISVISEQSSEVVVGHRGGDTISIQVLGRTYPDSTGYWDSNWLTTHMQISIGPFRAVIPASLRTDELHRFEERLRRLHASGHKEVLFESMEEWLTLSFKNDSAGYILISGRVVDRPGSPNGLSFRIEKANQSDVAATIEELEKVNAAFPVLGTP
jgi:hypothetical protein